MDLIFVTDRSQVESLAIAPGNLLTKLLPVTGNLAAAECLDRLGVPFVDEWCYLTNEDIGRNWDTAHKLGADWWDESLASLQYEHFSMAEAARCDVVFPFEMCLNAATIYERILSEYSKNKLFIFPIPRVPVSRTGPPPLIQASASMGQAVLRWIARSKGLKLRPMKSTLPHSTEGVSTAAGRRYPIAAKTNDRNYKAVPCVEIIPEAPGHFFWQTEPAGRPAGSHRRLALVVASLQNHLELNALERAILADENWDVVRLILQEKNSFTAVPWHTRSLNRQFNHAWRALPTFEANYKGPYPALFANPLLRFQFRSIWRDMLLAARLGESFVSVVETLQPDVAVFAHEAFALERTMVRIAQARNIPTAALVHGGVRPNAGYRGLVGDADRLFLWWDKDKEQELGHGLHRDRLRVIGSVRYASTSLPVVRPMSSTEELRRKTDARRILEVPADRPVVVFLTASISHGFANPFVEPCAHRETWHQLREIARRTPEVTFITKPHPAFDLFEFYRQLQLDAPANFLLRETDSLDLVLDSSDVAVLVNYPTTAALEAMCRNVPVVSLQTAAYTAAGRDSSLADQPLLTVPSTQELEMLLPNILTDSEQRDKAVLNGRAIFAAVTGNGVRDARIFLMEQIKDLVSNSECGSASVSTTLVKRFSIQFNEMMSLVNQGAVCGQLLAICESIINEICNDSTLSVDDVRRTLFRVSLELGRARGSTAELQSAIARLADLLHKDPRIDLTDLRFMRLNSLLAHCSAEETDVPRWRVVARRLKRLLFGTASKNVLGRFVLSVLTPPMRWGRARI